MGDGGAGGAERGNSAMSGGAATDDMALATARVRVRRQPACGRHDRSTINAILDTTFLCHVGFVVDRQPYVIPTAFGREGTTLYFHGASASRMLRQMAAAVPVCITVTIVDGLVLARSAFHHSINYRSVVLLGSAAAVAGEARMRALRIISDHIIPGRWPDVRPPSESELKATSVLKIDIREASAKIRTGPPVDNKNDMQRPCWAGVLPLAAATGNPLADPHMRPDVASPRYLAQFAAALRAKANQSGSANKN